MTLTEWIEKMKMDLDSFAEYWKANNVKTPADYPDSMDEQDWREQFDFSY